jgi:hypothetical protein
MQAVFGRKGLKEETESADNREIVRGNLFYHLPKENATFDKRLKNH